MLYQKNIKPMLRWVRQNQNQYFKLQDSNTLHRHDCLGSIENQNEAVLARQRVQEQIMVQKQVQGGINDENVKRQHSFISENEQENQLTQKSQQFQFPLQVEVMQMKKIHQPSSVRRYIDEFLKRNHHEGKLIKFNTKKLGRVEDKKNKKMFFHMVTQFNCCKGLNGTRPFIHFKSIDDLEPYTLQNFNIKHNHPLQKTQLNFNQNVELKQKVTKKIKKTNLQQQKQSESISNQSSQNISYQQQQETKNIKIQSEKRSSAFLWYKYFCQILSRQLQQRRFQQIKDLKLELLIKKQYRLTEYNYVGYYTKQIKQIDLNIWIQCGKSLFQNKGYEKINLNSYAHSQNQNNLNQKLLFIIKREKLKQYKLVGQHIQSSLTVFMSCFPLKIKNKEFNLVLCYGLLKNLQPILIWFSLTKNMTKTHENLNDFICSESNFRLFSQIFQSAFNYLNLEVLNIILTTANAPLIKSLQATNKKMRNKQSSKRIQFTLQILSLKDLVINQQKKSQVLQYIAFRICQNNAEDKAIQAYEYLKGLFTSKNKEKYKKNEFINPRIHYENLKIFFNLFSQFPYQRSNYNYMCFLTKQIFKESKKAGITDPISQISDIFGILNKLNSIQQLFAIILCYFEQKTIKSSEVNQFIPYEFVWQKIEKQNYNQELRYNVWFRQDYFEQLIHKNYQLFQVIKCFPRIVIQTVYRLIKCSYSLKLLENQHQLNQNTVYVISKYQTDKMFSILNLQLCQLNISSHSNNDRTLQNHIDASNKISSKKKWLCSCNFYIQTGIPCEHQLFCAIKSKSSIFNEINPDLNQGI